MAPREASESTREKKTIIGENTKISISFLIIIIGLILAAVSRFSAVESDARVLQNRVDTNCEKINVMESRIEKRFDTLESQINEIKTLLIKGK